jgi:predicted GIY-YIG superfamily endonuclease
MFDVYCVSCVTPNHYYFGITKNRESRFKHHENGRTPFTAFHGVKTIEVVASSLPDKRLAELLESELTMFLKSRYPSWHVAGGVWCRTCCVGNLIWVQKHGWTSLHRFGPRDLKKYILETYSLNETFDLPEYRYCLNEEPKWTISLSKSRLLLSKRTRPSSPSSVSRIKKYIRARVPSGIVEEKALGFLLKYLSTKYRPRHIIKAFDRAFEEGTLKNLLQHVAAVQRDADFKSKRRGSAH